VLGFVTVGTNNGFVIPTVMVSVTAQPLAVTVAIKEVVVSNKGEDPAYEIIRNAIKQRPTYLKEFNNFKCQVCF
jgi:hypothetical protein